MTTLDAPDPPRSLWVRFLILRLLALVYAAAFLVAARQGPPLVGEHGLMPTPLFLDRLLAAQGSIASAALRVPTLFWLGFSDHGLAAVAWTGFALSLVSLAGATNALLQLSLWALYTSIANVGQRFWGYGWESQLLETGILSAFLCPVRTVRPFASEPPRASVWLFRWLVVRIMLGAGLIKIRGDDCWRALTCLDHHFETQPIPNPLTPYFHALPAWGHRVGVAVNHAVELVAPLFAFGPRRARLAAGAAFIAFQVTLILSGNLSFLNWLTIVPALACLDDAALARLLPARHARAASPSAERAAIVWTVLVAFLSIPVVVNLLSPDQAMNTTYEPLRLVNTYGAFGSVGKERHEVILEGTRDAEIGPDTRWEEYELPCKPGDVRRRPCWLSPYHLRLDWQLWFAGFGTIGREPWLAHLVWKLLEGGSGVRALLAKDPFPDAPPRFIRAELFRYELLPPGDPSGAVWRRSREGTYLPPVSLDDADLRAFLAHHGWLP